MERSSAAAAAAFRQTRRSSSRRARYRNRGDTFLSPRATEPASERETAALWEGPRARIYIVWTLRSLVQRAGSGFWNVVGRR